MIHKRIIILVVIIALTASFLSVPLRSTSTVRAAASWTLATTVSPVLLYEASAGAQPLVLYLQDNNGAPVDTTGIADLTWSYGSPATFTESAPPRQISNGYWLLAGTPVTGTADVRFSVAGTVGGAALASNAIIIPVRTLGAWNPQALFMTHDSLLQNTAGYLLYGKHVYDRLPCTVGNSVEILTVLYAPKNLAENYPGFVVKKSTTEVRGNVTKGAAAAWPVENVNILLGVASGNKYFVNQAGVVSVQVNTDIWWFLDAACTTLDEGRNAQAHSYSKAFEFQQTLKELPVVQGITLSKNADGTHDVRTAFSGQCASGSWAVDIVALKQDGSVDERFGTAGHVWYNGIPADQYPAGTGIPDLPGQGLGGDGTAFGASTVIASSDCTSLTVLKVDFSRVRGDTLVLWLYRTWRTYKADGTQVLTHPAVYVGSSSLIAPYLETTVNATTAVKTLVAGVTQSVPISNAAFSAGTPSWTTTLDGSAEGIPQYKPVASSSGAWTVDMTPALPRAGTLRLTGVALNLADAKRETMTLSWNVVMPEFTVTLGLSDGTTIPNDHVLTEGVVELIEVTAKNPLTGGPLNVTPTSLSQQACSGSGGLPTCVVSGEGEAMGLPWGSMPVSGIDNPYFSGSSQKGQFDVYASLGGTRVLVDTFTLTPPVLTVTPTEVPFTIPATATRLDFHARDAHGHPLADSSIQVMGATLSPGLQYEFIAGEAITDSAGEAGWTFPPPYSGKYTASVERDLQWPAGGSECVFSSWKRARRSHVGATITAKYKPAELDTMAPVITVSQGIDGATVTASSFTVTGKVTDNVGVTQLFVGFNKINVLSDGSFTTTVNLSEGMNTLTIVAYDAAGNKGTVSVDVTYRPPVAPPAPKTTIILLAIGSTTATVDGARLGLDVAPEIVGGRTFVPIRFIAETFGADVEWLPVTQGITITLGDHTIGLQIGNPSAVVDGSIITMEAAPYIKKSRTMVPLRLIAQAFGCDVAWDPVARSVTIAYRKL
jgi:hypothetical protein